ncbi:bifunctional tRNA (5-methylaminomethyl-2-thiouridine)(34)-methyltransferase MnmD/FAD-dependent 5-carboxymethylaminomethyl-2-thiouridine(34) oxidoreductase MnmC [Rhodanobacter aciditrophus]|uniref:tRNA 5-methylaminomethyl-2-thiouridine biosynthesis bifunctional protein MnmC n=1 Tax=Rhodanobacter aciditrophus TaxID=1623218 RepID=A0ABW4B3W5_9GAMM
MLTSYRLEAPTLHFGDDGVPRSATFDDVYFDKEAGLAETRYVFLEHNRLTERFGSLLNRNFTIAETGFGTGLNFLCALECFLQHAPDTSWLHFVSVEKYPLSKASLTQSLAMWPSLQPLADELIAHYPQQCHGLHRVELPQLRTTLTLWFGEASEGFTALDAQVDAWFLDGFAPSKNPDMWSDQLFQQINRLSHSDTTFATFTAAGIVRRGLQSHGFQVQKVKGFGHKREMMIGQFLEDEQTTRYSSTQPAWFASRPLRPMGKVIVIGSGLAGATTAHALAQKNIAVEVWEQADHIAAGASGNEQGMLYPKLGASDTPVNRLYLSSYLYAHNFYQQYADKSIWQHCGLTQLPKDDAEQLKFEKITRAELYPDAILKAVDGKLILPLSGWVRPKALCETLLSHANITVHLNRPLEQIKTTTEGFELLSNQHTYHCNQVILCTANQQDALAPWTLLPTKPIRGQVSQLPISTLDIPSQVKAREFKQVICADGYVSPALDDQLNFGATYDLKNEDLTVTGTSHSENISKLADLLPIDVNESHSSLCQGRASLRCTVSDYTPIVGPVSATASLINALGPLRTNAKWQTNEEVEKIEGLYVNLGHGSRGLVSTPLCANYLASLMLGEPLPIETAVTDALHPNRFTIRKLKRGEV